MLSRRSLLASAGALSVAGAEDARMHLCLHQTTSAAAGYRASLEGYARAGIRFVEVIPRMWKRSWPRKACRRRGAY